MTEQNNSRYTASLNAHEIEAVTGHPQLTNWQPELSCPFEAIDTFSQELKASEIADDIAALNFRTWNPFNENDLEHYPECLHRSE